MIDLNGKQYYTSLELAREVQVQKTYICRLAREGRLSHTRTSLGYLFPVETALSDWEQRFRKADK